MQRRTFELPDYSLDEIKRDYHLFDLCVQNTAQLENVAITIQSLYLYQNILQAGDYPRSMEASLCRTIIIMGYSVIEALVVSVGYQIQRACERCKHRCKYASTSMFHDAKAHINASRAFQNADTYLEAIGVRNLTPNAKAFYDLFRSSRNNVHLTRNAKVISKDGDYTREHCLGAAQFLQGFVQMLYENTQEFVATHRCEV